MPDAPTNALSFEPHTLEFLISPDIVATVSFRCRGDAKWDAATIGRLIMALEMQRGFLAGKEFDVGVSISTPRPHVPNGSAEALQLTHADGASA